MSSELGKRAEEYARSGWAVFALRPRDKTPLTTHGFKDATTNMDVIRQLWSKTPDANIGLNCGKSGIVVIDLDKRADHDGLAEWDAFSNKHHLHPRTSTSLTGGGGKHMLFKTPKGVTIPNSVGRMAPGIDVRGEGGYIVLPPSVHPSGKEYCWADDTTTIEILPDSVVEILTHEPDPWQAYTLRDAFAPRPPLVWIVDNIISERSLTIWFGSPGTLKSMLLTDMAVCVATGARWLSKPNQPNTGIATIPTAVMWLDFDNGERRTHERFAALARARKLNDAAPITYYSMPMPRLASGDGESIRRLQERIVNRNVGLVVIDNLGKITGGLDENSADMQAVMDGLRHLAESGLAVIVIHHQRKTTGDNKSARAGETLRGHSSIEAAIDLAMLVTREEENVTITPTKTRGHTVKELNAKFEFENDDYHELVTARFWPLDMSPAQAEQAEEQKNLRDNILEFVGKEGPCSANAVFEYVGGSRNHVLDVLRQMNLERLLAKKANPRGGFLLILP